MDKEEHVRVRFAPSPTGYFHVGGARTALYNWLFARQSGGKFILRIEDTDTERSDPTWTAGILQALSWLNINIDEGPYFQSERKDLYLKAAEKLFLSGNAYACDCNREDVLKRTEGTGHVGYDNYCRDRGLAPADGRVLRFLTPDSGITVVNDIVRGEVEFANTSIDDFVLVKSNGDPLFVLAVVVDDQDMGITHIIRAEEHLPTTPKAILLWHALSDKKVPTFAHLPVLVNEKRQKLSKRRDKVAVEEYKEMGILPEAMVNYLTILGWSPKDGSEIFEQKKALAEFSLKEVNHSPAFFDEKRLLYFNGQYIRALSDQDFTQRLLPYLEESYPKISRDDILEKLEPLVSLVKERAATLREGVDLLDFLFKEPFAPDEEDLQKVVINSDFSRQLLEEVLKRFLALTPTDSRNSAVNAIGKTESEEAITTGEKVSGHGLFVAEVLKDILTESGALFDLKLAKAQAPIRVATLGKKTGLPLFESLEVLGFPEVIKRLRAAIEKTSDNK